MLDRPSPGVATLRINRPEARGSLNRAALQLLVASLDELAKDPEIAALVLSSTDPAAFCAGADVREVLDDFGGEERMREFTELYAALERFPGVTICAMVGNTVGGGAELAAACDLRIAGDNLKLRWVGGLLGVPVGAARLAPLVGLATARHLVFTSPVVTAEDALRFNLTFEVVPAEQAHDRALELATDIASRPVPNIRNLKRMFRDYDETERRTIAENHELMLFQRSSHGLPSGASK